MKSLESILQQIRIFASKSPADSATRKGSLTARPTVFSKSQSLNRTSKISIEKQIAQLKYKDLTSRSKQQQLSLIRGKVKARNPQWHQFSHTKNAFSCFETKEMNQFPHNARKYNAQFLQKSIRGRSLNFTIKDTGFFPKPNDSNYSQHYKPIARKKRSYNQDWQLRPSIFGKTWVDLKRDRIIDQYELQENPFNTQRSNQLIATMRPARKHRFS